MRPARHCAGGGIWRGENAEFRNSAASGELAFRLHCRTDSAVLLVGYSTQLHSKISVLFTVHTNTIVVPVPIRISIADLIRGGGRRQHRRLPRAAKTLAPPLGRNCQPYSIDSSSDASFRSQYRSNLFVFLTLKSRDQILMKLAYAGICSTQNNSQKIPRRSQLSVQMMSYSSFFLNQRLKADCPGNGRCCCTDRYIARFRVIARVNPQSICYKIVHSFPVE